MATASPLPSNSSPTSTLPPSQPPPPPTASTPTDFPFPPHYSFPPFFTLQPTASTRSSQLSSWSTFIQSYCRHHRIFSLSLIDALETPLFNNTALRRRLSVRDAQSILSWMATSDGGNRAEFVSTGKKKASASASASASDEEGGRCWIYWRRPEEWSAVVEEWVERTGQRGTVLTLYEIVDGDASRKEEFWNMDIELLMRSLAVSVKRGKAQIFGGEGSEGVKFF